MGIFNDFFKKEKPVFTGSRFGFGSGGGGGGGTVITGMTASGGSTSTYTEGGKTYKVHTFTHPNSDNFVVTRGSFCASRCNEKITSRSSTTTTAT